jgi:hypothetical protein
VDQLDRASILEEKERNDAIAAALAHRIFYIDPKVRLGRSGEKIAGQLRKKD